MLAQQSSFPHTSFYPKYTKQYNQPVRPRPYSRYSLPRSDNTPKSHDYNQEDIDNAS